MTRKRKRRDPSGGDTELIDDSGAAAAGSDLSEAAVLAEEAGAPGASPAEVSEAGARPPEEVEQETVTPVQELEELRDRHLRLAAEHDNYRKRVVREREEIRARVQAEVVATVLDALDDLGRVLDVEPATARAEDVIAGVELVERKLLKELESAGLVRVGQDGERFDPNHHEAVGAEPAPSAEQEGLIAAVLQPGYRVGSVLVRPARVRVFVAPAPSEDGEPEA